MTEHPQFPRLGHVHVKVADLDRAIEFYSKVIGLEVQQRMEQAAFLSSDGYHHHLGLNTWQSAGATPPPPGHTGLFHTAFLYPDRSTLAGAVKRAMDAGFPIEGASDHGVSEAIYMTDPEGNGVELYVDRPEQDWPRDASGGLAMVTRRLDLEALLEEA